MDFFQLVNVFQIIILNKNMGFINDIEKKVSQNYFLQKENRF